MNGNDGDQNIWDGTESEIINDSQASKFENDNIGIKLSYVLTKEEIFNAIYNGNLFRKNSKKKDIFYIIVFLIFCVCFLIFYVINHNIQNIVMAVFCVLAVLGVLIIPKLYIKKFAENMANNKELEVCIFSDRIDVGKGMGKWSIDFNKDCIVQEVNNLFVVTNNVGNSVVIPHRAIEPDLLADISAIMMSVGIDEGQEE